ncbi:MAG: T9SS type A sorting domain-containing protein [Chitinophagaceae bacterium]
MRNAILALSIALLPFAGNAQTFVTQNGTDSANATYTGGGGELTIYNRIKSASSDSVIVTWKVTDSHLDPNWAFTGICDNNTCITNDAVANPPKGFLLNGGGVAQTSLKYGPSYEDFHALYECTAAANGTSSWIKVNARDLAGSYSTNLYFIGFKNATGVTTTITSSDDVTLYPNPARDAINVLFNRNADVRTIAVFNLIGKMVGPLYRTSSSTSAKIQLVDMPNGIYFIRLMNSQGHVVATRRFTRQ